MGKAFEQNREPYGRLLTVFLLIFAMMAAGFARDLGNAAYANGGAQDHRVLESTVLQLAASPRDLGARLRSEGLRLPFHPEHRAEKDPPPAVLTALSQLFGPVATQSAAWLPSATAPHVIVASFDATGPPRR